MLPYAHAGPRPHLDRATARDRFEICEIWKSAPNPEHGMRASQQRAKDPNVTWLHLNFSTYNFFSAHLHPSSRHTESTICLWNASRVARYPHGRDCSMKNEFAFAQKMIEADWGNGVSKIVYQVYPVRVLFTYVFFASPKKSNPDKYREKATSK